MIGDPDHKYTSFYTRMQENQMLHFIGLGLFAVFYFIKSRFQQFGVPDILILIALVAIAPFSWIYRSIDRLPLSVEVRYGKLVQAAFTRSLIDIGVITAAVHLLGGPDGPMPILYFVLIGFVSMIYPIRESLLLTTASALSYIILLLGYIYGLLQPVRLPAGLGYVTNQSAIIIVVILGFGAFASLYAQRLRLAGEQAFEQARHLENLQKFTRLGLEQSQLSELYAAMAQEIRVILGADGIYLTQWEADQEQVHPKGAAGAGTESYASMPPVPKDQPSLTAHARRAGKTLAVRNVFHTPYLSAQIAQDFPARAMLVVPLYGLDDLFLGALLVAKNTVHDFSAEEMARAAQVGEIAALLISRARLYERSREQVKMLEQLSGQVADLTISHADLPQVISEQARALLHARSVAFFRMDGIENWVRCEYARGFSPALLMHMDGYFNTSPHFDDLNQQKLFFYPDLHGRNGSSQMKKMLAREKTASFLCLVFESRRGIEGLVALGWDEPHAISETEITIGQMFARRAGAQIHNAEFLRQKSRDSLVDALTGLPNRRHFDQRLKEECERSDRYGHPFALLMLDLDGFKEINDTFGHTAGDSAIQQIAQLLSGAVRETDMVARFGGDEFSIIIPEIDREGAAHLCQKIVSVFSQAELNLPGGQRRHPSGSIGLAMYPHESAEPIRLFELADERMYQAKRSGRGRVVG